MSKIETQKCASCGWENAVPAEACSTCGAGFEAEKPMQVNSNYQAVEYRIWSNEHGAWWNPNSAGYTLIISKAGLYSFEEANRICKGAGNYKSEPAEVMVAATGCLATENARLKEDRANLEQLLTDAANALGIRNEVHGEPDTLIEAIEMKMAEVQALATLMHYPECWDTAAYPSIWAALRELASCNPADCIITPPPPAAIAAMRPADEGFIEKHSPAIKKLVELGYAYCSHSGEWVHVETDFQQAMDSTTPPAKMEG